MEQRYLVVLTVTWAPEIGMAGHVAPGAVHSTTIGPFNSLFLAQDASSELRKGDDTKAKYRTVVVQTQ